MWLYSFVLKLLPCAVLTVFTGSLIQAMYQVRGWRLLYKLIKVTILCRLRRHL